MMTGWYLWALDHHLEKNEDIESERILYFKSRPSLASRSSPMMQLLLYFLKHPTVAMQGRLSCSIPNSAPLLTEYMSSCPLFTSPLPVLSEIKGKDKQLCLGAPLNTHTLKRRLTVWPWQKHFLSLTLTLINKLFSNFHLTYYHL